MKVVPYTLAYKSAWNDFVRNSKTGTFILEREYMDYHADRFQDCSILLFDDDCCRLKALFPANWVGENRCVWSHQGLTYGGLLTETSVTQTEVLTMFEAICSYYRTAYKASCMVYKPIPYIYSMLPSDEDLYALFRMEAAIKSRLTASVVNMKYPLKMQTLRRRKANLAKANGLIVCAMQPFEWPVLCRYWSLLDEVLQERHQAHPVHTFDEMKLLMQRYPDNIKLHVVMKDEEIVAGTVVYETRQVARVQYIASGHAGRQLGALDLLFEHLLQHVYAGVPYFDFGTSNEECGRVLNEGLIFQKEGFGGRTVCYDCYHIRLSE